MKLNTEAARQQNPMLQYEMPPFAPALLSKESLWADGRHYLIQGVLKCQGNQETVRGGKAGIGACPGHSKASVARFASGQDSLKEKKNEKRLNVGGMSS